MDGGLEGHHRRPYTAIITKTARGGNSEMDLTNTPEYLKAVRERIVRLEEEMALLQNMLDAGTAWTNLNVGQQLASPVESATSFPKGVELVLRNAAGETLRIEEIWERMQVLGVRSNGKRPAYYVSLHAERLRGVEKGEKGAYRWVGDESAPTP